MPRANRGPHLWRPKGSDGPWYVRQFVAGRAVCRTTGEPDRRAAEAVLARAVLERDRPQLPAEPTIADLLPAYVTAKAGANSLKTIKSRCKVVAATAGMWSPAEVAQRHIRSYIAIRKQAGIQPGTIRVELATLRAALRWAAAEDLIAPPRPWRIPVSAPPRERWLTADECDRLVATATRTHIRTFLALALHTGARSGAIADLRWEHVDLDRLVVAYPAKEGGKRRVSVPINETLLPVLLAAREAATSNWVVEWGGRRVARPRDAWATLLKLTGIAHATIHDLRRTAGSLMIQRGVPIELVSAVLGHSDIGITRKVYAHLLVDHLRGAVRKLESTPATPPATALKSSKCA